MIQLRMRFSGMCLFHKPNNLWRVCVLQEPGHKPVLWFDPATCTVTVQGGSTTPNTYCFVELDQNGSLHAVERTIEESAISQKETIRFDGVTGTTNGAPGAVSFGDVHPPVLTGVNENQDIAAIIELSGGQLVPGPDEVVVWNQLPGGTRPPAKVHLWTDFLLDDPTASFFTLKSSRTNRSWAVTPNMNEVAHVWVLSHSTSSPTNPKVGLHFKHHFSRLHGAEFEPYPELVTPLPVCPQRPAEVSRNRSAEALTGSSATVAAGSSSFCPDGQYP